MSANANAPVPVTVFRWAGAWGPFKVRIPCGECALTGDVIKDCLATDLAGIEVNLETRDWLSEWWKPLAKGGWHAPIVLVNDRLLCQGAALNRGLFVQAVIEAATAAAPVTGSHVFGKAGCPHCGRARDYLEQAQREYQYHDVIKNPRALYEMLARVKPIIGPRTPVTVPQIWIDGRYVGGSDALRQLLKLSDAGADAERE